MLKDQEPDRNISDLTDEEIYYAIHGLERPSRIERGSRSWWRVRTAIIFLILLLGVIAFIWFDPR
jgi:hypothetical protein